MSRATLLWQRAECPQTLAKVVIVKTEKLGNPGEASRLQIKNVM
jgi:hypothetical protein